ncbi:MAG: TlpA family protein disulfide reductase [Dysgonamonadaceae bacterium]|jgi:thiol-disulfide isomerase/thioredoxin|nr:TlpA family protein disulfide reductase [Dysgonamonadaceae bacterium]
MRKIGLFLGFMLGVTFFTNAQQLPSVQIKDLNGKTVDTALLSNDGKPFIITFFATWCKPCLRELEAIKEVYEDWREETGVKLIAISIDDAQNALKVGPETKAKGWTYEILLDSNAEFRRALGGSLIPAAFVVDGNGKIVHSRTGYTNGSEEQLIEEVRKLVNE